MKLQSMTFVAISIIGFFIFAGCEKQGYASYEDVPSKDEILQRIDELPMRLHSRQWREVDRFAYSDICCAVRQLTNLANGKLTFAGIERQNVRCHQNS